MIVINDITLREGEQSAGVNFFPEEKLRIAEQLVKMRVPIIEASFAVASEADLIATKMIASRFGTKDGPVICSMARANKKDIEIAAEAVSPAAKGRIQVVLSTSDIHIKYQLGKTRTEIRDMAYEMVRYARTLSDDVEFAAMDATRSDPDFLIEVFKACIEAGAKTLEIPDTVGYATPSEYAAIVRAVVGSVPQEIVVATHCHDDVGLAVANTLAGMVAGARQLEVTVNGIGERAGNAALEEVVMAVRVRQDYYQVDFGLDTTQIASISRLVAELADMPVAKNKAVVGRNAFLHESGIHQHGLLLNKETYQILEPGDIGLDRYELVLGKLSGKHALKQRLEELGLRVLEDEFEAVYLSFKELASKKKVITNEDIRSLCKKVR